MFNAEMVQRKYDFSCFIISKENVHALRFDFLTCVLVLFDCFLVPMKSSFGLDFMGQKTKENFQILEYLITAIFFLDLILGFVKAYNDEKTGD